MTKEAFAEQVLALRRTMYYVSYSLLPNPADQEDAVQEAISKGLQKCGSLREEQYLKRWILRILINECYNVMRRRKREFPAEEIPVVTPDVPDTGAFEAVMRLEEKLRVPIVLCYVEGYTTREIAEILRTPEGTVKTRMAKARALLRQALQSEQEQTEGLA